MPTTFNDIITPRLILRLMDSETVDACLAGDLAKAGKLLGVQIPTELLEHPSSLTFAQLRLQEDPGYTLWSARAIILRDEKVMVGTIRFHTIPDAEYLHKYAPNAVEFGYLIFSSCRRRGYATEAVKNVMNWAKTKYEVFNFVASVSPSNVPSLKLIEKFGFEKVDEIMDEVDGMEYVFLRRV